MKIIHLISGGDVGGAKTHVHSLLSGLHRTEQVLLVCFMDGPFAQEARELGIPTAVMAGRNLMATCRELIALIEKEQFQIVHCHGSRANMIGAMIRGHIPVPVVTTVHSDYRLDYLGRPLGRLIYGNINTISLRKLDYRIGVSDAMADLLISRGFDPQRMFSIYNGVDFTPITPAQDRQTYLSGLGVSLEPDSVVFGIAARLNPVKDIGTLIRAFAQTVQAHPHSRLVIAGDGEQMAQLQALAKELCPAGTVCFAGWVTDTDSFYNAIDVNMLTSLSETFPYALTEGARMHCATIASRVGGVPKLIDHGVCGLLFQPQDVQMLSAHMCLLAGNDELRHTLADRLYEKARAQFSQDATVEHQKEIYQTILRRQERLKRSRDGVLICGAYGKGNAGDDAILDAIIAQMKDIDPDLPLYVLSRTPRATQVRYHIGAIHTFNFFGFLRRMRRTVLYLSGGGSLIQDVTSSRSLYYYLSNLRYAKRTGNRTVLYGCGIGPVTRSHNRVSAGQYINNYADLVLLREPSSAQELHSMGVVQPEIRITADPALLLPPLDSAAAESVLLSAGLQSGGKYVMFALRPWPGFDKKLSAYKACAEYAYQAHGLTPVFLALEPNRDLLTAKKVADALECPSIVLSAPSDGRAIMAMMEAMQCVIAMRLHALIFAAGRGVPLVGTVYDPKVSGFLEYIGQKHFLDFSAVTSEALCRLLDEALSGGGVDRETMERLHALAMQNEDAVRQFLEAQA